MMKRIKTLTIILLMIAHYSNAQKPSIWLLTDFTGIKTGKTEYNVKNKEASQLNTQSDPDDYVALSIYLMNANKFNTRRIVLGSDRAPNTKSTNALKEFNNRFLTAYKHDVQYWNGTEGPGGFPSPELIHKTTTVASTQGSVFNPEKSYKNIDKLPATVIELVKELENDRYSYINPLYVLAWGPLTEVAIAIKHLKENQKNRVLENLFIVSHWTTSFINHNKPSRCNDTEPAKTKYGVANCNEDCLACKYIHNEAAKKNARFRFVDIGAIGQNGIVDGTVEYFHPGGLKHPKAQAFLSSEMGKLLINSNFTYNRPDGSDCASFYAILGNYGVTLSDFNDNGVLTPEDEKSTCRIFKNQAKYMFEELLGLSNIVYNSKHANTPEELIYPLLFKADGNPFVKHIRTADPDCHVWDDGRLWMYTSQDHDSDSITKAKVGHGYSKMDGYHVFSTTDMETWIDHGEILHSRDVPWGTDDGGWMWAPGAAYKNGTYYLYFPHYDKTNNWRTGVATSKTPYGPFTAEPNYIEGTTGIDPMCLIDNDGTAYLYFGHAMVAKLSNDMLKLAEKPRHIEYGGKNFREGPYMHKRNEIYYYSWTDWKDPVDQGYYSMGDNPYGPFDFKGAVNANPPGAQDHHSIIEYKGQWYYFYHVGSFKDKYGKKGRGFRRNVCVDYLYYNSDGTMQKVKQTKESVSKIK